MGKVVDERILPHDRTALSPMILWACPPEGCGRILLEGSGGSIKGTWYSSEENIPAEGVDS